MPETVVDELAGIQGGAEYLVLTQEYGEQLRAVLGWSAPDERKLRDLTLGALQNGRVLVHEPGPTQDVLFVAVEFRSSAGRFPAMIELHRTRKPSPGGNMTVTFACRAEAVG